MTRFGILLCAFVLSGCNSMIPGLSAPEVSAPPPASVESPEETGVIATRPVADLDCAPRTGPISCR